MSKQYFQGPIQTTVPQEPANDWGSPDTSKNFTYNEIVALDERLTRSLVVQVTDGRVIRLPIDPSNPPLSVDDVVAEKAHIDTAIQWEIQLATFNDEHSSDWHNAKEIARDFHAIQSQPDPLKTLKETMQKYFPKMSDSDYGSWFLRTGFQDKQNAAIKQVILDLVGGL